jgi:hypothetical protein
MGEQERGGGLRAVGNDLQALERSQLPDWKIELLSELQQDIGFLREEIKDGLARIHGGILPLERRRSAEGSP